MNISVQKMKLLSRRAEIVSNLAEIEHSLDERPPNDWEDRASERQGDEVLEALGHVETDELRKIDAALGRIDDGTYGVCPKCGERISDDRLASIPEAALCRYCMRNS